MKPAAIVGLTVLITVPVAALTLLHEARLVFDADGLVDVVRTSPWVTVASALAFVLIASGILRLSIALRAILASAVLIVFLASLMSFMFRVLTGEVTTYWAGFETSRTPLAGVIDDYPICIRVLPLEIQFVQGELGATATVRRGLWSSGNIASAFVGGVCSAP